MKHFKRVKTSDPIFNTIQELIFLYRKCERQKKKHGYDEPVTLQEFIEWLVIDGWTYDEGES